MAEVKLENICKTYKEGTQAVKNISCVIEDQEFVVLVGPSGCGKTTALRMIAGLEEITSGTLFIDGEEVNDLPPSKRQISMVFQNYALYPHMTAFGNMAFGLKIQNTPKAEIAERVNEAAKILNITEILNKKPRKMSGGQRQRIAIGRAIVRHPKVFLFDEPLSNLDAKLRGQMRIELAKLHQKLKATIIYVTHDQVEAMTLADKIIVMNQGEIMQIDSPMEIFQNPRNKFVAEFIGSPKMNFISGTIQKNKDKFLFQNDVMQIDLTALSMESIQNYRAKEVDMGFRSEDVYAENSDLNNSFSLEAKVVARELLGNEKLVYGDFHGSDIIAKFRSEYKEKLNQVVRFHVNMDKIYLFDRDSGNRIY